MAIVVGKGDQIINLYTESDERGHLTKYHINLVRREPKGQEILKELASFERDTDPKTLSEAIHQFIKQYHIAEIHGLHYEALNSPNTTEGKIVQEMVNNLWIPNPNESDPGRRI